MSAESKELESSKQLILSLKWNQDGDLKLLMSGRAPSSIGGGVQGHHVSAHLIF